MREVAKMDAEQQKSAETKSYQTITRPWEKSIEEICRRLEVSPAEGLSASQVNERRNRYGANRLREAKAKSPWSILFNLSETAWRKRCPGQRRWPLIRRSK